MKRKVPKKARHRPLKKLYAATIGKIGTLNLILIVVFIFFICFNQEMLQLFKEHGAIPETYACAVIAATIGECGICGWIRTTKDRKREWKREDEQAERQKEQPVNAEPPSSMTESGIDENETKTEVIA